MMNYTIIKYNRFKSDPLIARKSFRTGTNMLPAVTGAFVLGFSSIVTGINF